MVVTIIKRKSNNPLQPRNIIPIFFLTGDSPIWFSLQMQKCREMYCYGKNLSLQKLKYNLKKVDLILVFHLDASYSDSLDVGNYSGEFSPHCNF